MELALHVQIITHSIIQVLNVNQIAHKIAYHAQIPLIVLRVKQIMIFKVGIVFYKILQIKTEIKIKVIINLEQGQMRYTI